MKVENVTGIKKKFEPIELQVTIESEDELLSLWHRLHASGTHFNAYLKDYSHELKHDDDYALWAVLNEEVNVRGIEK